MNKSTFSCIIICSISIAVFLRLAYKAYDKDYIDWSIKRWKAIFKTQLCRTLRQIRGHFFLSFAAIVTVVLVTIVFIRIKADGWLNVAYTINENSSYIPVTTTTTTVFSALLTVLLALVALAVTAYVFLNDALSNREEYEQGIIYSLKSKSRRKLFTSCVASGLCITVCLVVDNANLHLYLQFIRYCTVIASFVEIVSLILFINSIVNYEKHMLELARSYIQFNQMELCKEAHKQKAHNESKRDKVAQGNDNNGQVVSEFIKSIGELEKLITSILSNHESDYYPQKRMISSNMLRTVLERKQNEKNEEPIDENDEVHNTSHEGNREGKSIGDTCEEYRRLIEIRNCIWVLQDSGEIIDVQPGLTNLVSSIENDLKEFAFQKERFNDISLDTLFFSNGFFSQSSFRGSAILNTDFSGANLCNCDFSDGLLQDVDLKGSNCENAVFVNTRIVYPEIDERTIFRGAVFRECEFTLKNNSFSFSSREEPESAYPYNFKSISGQRANFLGANLKGVDFEKSVFTEASFAGSKIESCNLKWADLKGAVLADAVISGYCCFEFADCSGIVAANSQWIGTMPKETAGRTTQNSDKTCIKLIGARFAHANMTDAKFTNCSFFKAYINDATFVSAKLTNCLFEGALLTNADFTDAQIRECDFSEAILVNTLFAGHKEIDKGNGQDSNTDSYVIKGTNFGKAEMNRCSIRNHVFKECKFDNAVLDEAVIRDVTFKDCSFYNTHFNGALLFNVKWNRCTGFLDKEAVQNVAFGTAKDRKSFKKKIGSINLRRRRTSDEQARKDYT